jgi:hypothetical protein
MRFLWAIKKSLFHPENYQDGKGMIRCRERFGMQGNQPNLTLT